jgi:hypothetical protein
MAEGTEERTVKIIWEVDDQTQKGIDSAVRRQQQATDAIQRGQVVGTTTPGKPADTGKAAADFNKIAAAAGKANQAVAPMGERIKNAASGTKKLAEQAQSVIGKLSGMAGAAGLVVGAIGAVVVATVEWAESTKKLDEDFKKAQESYLRMVSHYDEIAADKAATRAIHNQNVASSQSRRAKAVEDEALELEHVARILTIEGQGQEHVNQLMIEALELRRSLAGEATFEARAIERQIEVIRAQGAADKKKGRGGGSGPSAADRVRAEGEARLQALQSEIELSERQYELNNTGDLMALAIIDRRRDAKLAELQLEREVLDVTKAKNSVERQEITNRQAQIDREMELAALDATIQKRGIANDLAADALALAKAKAEIEARASGRVVDLADARLKRDIELAQIQGDSARAHTLTLQQIQAEESARLRLLDVKKAELLASDPDKEIDKIQRLDDLKQVAHDREMAQLESGLAYKRAVAAEEARIAEQRQAQLDEAIGTFETIQGSFVSTYQGISQHVQEVQDAGLETWKQNLLAQTESQKAALDRQIANAKGNSALSRELHQRKVALDKSTQKQIESAEKSHQEKRKRGEMRFQGVMLMIQGAVSVAKAASSYPNVPAMIAHAAAAAMNFAFGGMLLAGKVPGAGGAGAVGAGGSGATGTAPSGAERSNVDVQRTVGSVGGRAAERQGNRGKTIGDKSGNVTFMGNVTFNAMGSIDEDAAVKFAMGTNKGRYTREGAALK